MRVRTTPERGLTLEYGMWLFTRLSGLGLILLALAGALVAFTMKARQYLDMTALLRWTFFPNPFHVVNSSLSSLEPGWENAFWQVIETILVGLGITHGFNGLRVVLEDYLGPSLWRPLLRGVTFLLWIFMLIVAIQVIFKA